MSNTSPAGNLQFVTAANVLLQFVQKTNFKRLILHEAFVLLFIIKSPVNSMLRDGDDARMCGIEIVRCTCVSARSDYLMVAGGIVHTAHMAKCARRNKKKKKPLSIAERDQVKSE